ncbi:hypothetical protein F7725_001617, partial [Dissostichus mawsoni]
MKLWMMLLILLLHLGNAPWMKVVCVSLPAPSKVSISSLNMEHTLSFLPGPGTPPDARFTVQVLRLSRLTVSEVLVSAAVLGPPDVSLSGCGNCLLLRLGAPIAMEFSPTYRVHVQRTRDGVQFTLSLPYKEETVITYLQPGVEYCVTVSIWSVFNKNTVSSAPHCAFTSPPPSRSS